jgi:AraC-like DNA-binding protein
MNGTQGYGENLARRFRAEASYVATSDPRRSPLAVTRLRCDTPAHGLTGAAAPEKAFTVLLQLRAQPRRELFLGGRSVHREGYGARTTSIVDLEEEPRAYLASPFDALHFYVSRAALDEIAYERGSRRIDTLTCERGMLDETVWHLGMSLLPALARPREVGGLYVDHVLLATHTYFAQAFGGLRARSSGVARLAPWQMRRAIEVLLDDIGADVSLSVAAAACGLSASHFARAFKETTGDPPYRWLLRRRVEHAQALLRDPLVGLADAALACGFSDQSHFTRVFRGVVGTPPGAWRRGIMS